MPYTPVELRHVKLGRSLLGFSRDETERLLGDVADSFEDVWRERGELADRVEDLEKRLDELRQREALLASTLVSAEKAAAEAKDAAKRESELILAEAHGEARSIVRAAQTERERLFAEARRIEALLRAALGIVGESGVGEISSAAAPSDAGDGPAPPSEWPRREDTREFQVVRGGDQPLPVPEPPTAEEPPVVETAADEPQQQPEPQRQLPPERPAREFAWGD